MDMSLNTFTTFRISKQLRTQKPWFSPMYLLLNIPNTLNKYFFKKREKGQAKPPFWGRFEALRTTYLTYSTYSGLSLQKPPVSRFTVTKSGTVQLFQCLDWLKDGESQTLKAAPEGLNFNLREPRTKANCFLRDWHHAR